MSSAPWYQRYPQDFLMGTMGMPLEVRGAYSLLLDMMYDRGGPIPDDPRYLAGILNISVRKWHGIRAELTKVVQTSDGPKQKIYATDDGHLFNSRAAFEIGKRAKTSRKRAENGAKGGIKSGETRRESNKNNDLTEAKPKPYARVPEPEPEYIPNDREERETTDGEGAQASSLSLGGPVSVTSRTDGPPDTTEPEPVNNPTRDPVPPVERDANTRPVKPDRTALIVPAGLNRRTITPEQAAERVSSIRYVRTGEAEQLVQDWLSIGVPVSVVFDIAVEVKSTAGGTKDTLVNWIGEWRKENQEGVRDAATGTDGRPGGKAGGTTDAVRRLQGMRPDR